jgi:hypothetical protein
MIARLIAALAQSNLYLHGAASVAGTIVHRARPVMISSAGATHVDGTQNAHT